jgi:Mg-chelatase subunit ChlD/uncharacterized membrane protein
MLPYTLLTIGVIWLAVIAIGLPLDAIRSMARLSPRGRGVLRSTVFGLVVTVVVIGLFVLGGYVLSQWLELGSGWTWTLFGLGVALLVGLIAALLLAGFWSRAIALTGVGLLVFGAGGLWWFVTWRGLTHTVQTLRTVQLLRPWWLAMLIAIPLSVFLARRHLGLKMRQAAWVALVVVPGLLLPLLAYFGLFQWMSDRTEWWWSWLTLGVLFLGALRAFQWLVDVSEAWRPWLTLALRTVLIVILSLALAEPLLSQQSKQTTVLFVIDRSASIPEGGAMPDPDRPGRTIDSRTLRVLNFIRDSVRGRGAEHDRDNVGLIIFGRNPRLDLAPSDAPHLAGLVELPVAADATATDIAAALKLAAASFLPDTNKRIVLLSDGNENLGRAEDIARELRTKGIEIDVVPLGAGQRNEDEILIEHISAPRVTERGGKAAVTVQVRSYNPNIVVAKMTLKQTTDTGEEKQILTTGPDKKPGVEVRLRRGLNTYVFERPLTDEQQSYSYEAEVEPLRIESEKGDVLFRGRPPRDRVQNNRAVAHVVARGQRRVLIVEYRQPGKETEVVHDFLVKTLREAGDKKFKVEVRPSTVLNRDRDKLAAFLSNYDCIVLANVPYEAITEDQAEELRRNTHDHGCGLIMIGGENGFGSGGWQGSAVEKALPVDADIKSLKVEGKGGLVMIMHACEMPDGNMWEKKIAKLALERLGPRDEIGIIEFMGLPNWVPIGKKPPGMVEVGENRSAILTAIDKMMPSDTGDVTPALQMAQTALKAPEKGFGAKHVIFVTDGDPQLTDPNLPKKMKADGITVTTIMLVGHGQPMDKDRLKRIAQDTGGRFYDVQNPKDLPGIYIKESRLVSQSFVYEKQFTPQMVRREGPVKDLPEKLPNLHGFVRTTKKPSEGVFVPIWTPKFQDGQDFPVFAFWNYGLGKSAAFTSDAGRPKNWYRDWAEGGVYAKFWEQTVDWCMRPSESEQVKMKTEVIDGRIVIKLEATDEDKQPDTRLAIEARYSVSSGPASADNDKKRELRFVQRETAGEYVAEIKAEDAGTYFITARVKRKVKRGNTEVEEVEIVRAAETLPLAPEFSVVPTNTPLMSNLAKMTGGNLYADNEEELARVARDKTLFRDFKKPVLAKLPLWFWLVFTAGYVLLADVTARRLAVDTSKLSKWWGRTWLRLRGQIIPEPEREVVTDRLAPRRPAVRGDAARAAQRFEAPLLPTGPVPTAGAAPPPGPTPPAAEQPKPPEAETGDVFGRLAKAKKKIMDERKKDR